MEERIKLAPSPSRPVLYTYAFSVPRLFVQVRVLYTDTVRRCIDRFTSRCHRITRERGKNKLGCSMSKVKSEDSPITGAFGQNPLPSLRAGHPRRGREYGKTFALRINPSSEQTKKLPYNQ